MTTTAPPATLDTRSFEVRELRVRADVHGDDVVAFVNALRDLLVTNGERLRSCAKCARLFLAPRPKSIYCGRSCQNKAMGARYRERQWQTREEVALLRERLARLEGVRG